MNNASTNFTSRLIFYLLMRRMLHKMVTLYKIRHNEKEKKNILKHFINLTNLCHSSYSIKNATYNLLILYFCVSVMAYTPKTYFLFAFIFINFHS